MAFNIVLNQVLITLAFIIPGFILCKIKKATAEHLPTLSAVLVYICSPCMVINAFMSLPFSWHDFGLMMLFFAVTLVLQIAFMAVLYLVFRKRYHDPKYRVLTIGAVLGNVGFFGLPVVRAVMPEAPIATCYSSVFVISMNLLVFTMGIFCLTGDKKHMQLKNAFWNPTFMSFVVALPLYLFGVKAYLPTILCDAVKLVGDMTTPLCMIILGVRLATVSFKKLFSRPVVYLTCALKLIVFPLFCYACIYFVPVPASFKASILILCSVPCASVILNMAEMYHGERELAANTVLLSTLMCFLTIPVLTLLL